MARLGIDWAMGIGSYQPLSLAVRLWDRQAERTERRVIMVAQMKPSS